MKSIASFFGLMAVLFSLKSYGEKCQEDHQKDLRGSFRIVGVEEAKTHCVLDENFKVLKEAIQIKQRGCFITLSSNEKLIVDGDIPKEEIVIYETGDLCKCRG